MASPARRARCVLLRRAPPGLSLKMSTKMRIEPGDGAAGAVALVGGLRKVVAFAFVDDEPGFDAESFQGVPEFVGLRGGAFAVAVADDDERGRFDFLDESDG